MSRPRDFAVLRKSDPHSLFWDGKGKASGAGFLRALERSIPWLARAFANTDSGWQLKTHGIHQPIAIGRTVNTERKGD